MRSVGDTVRVRRHSQCVTHHANLGERGSKFVFKCPSQGDSHSSCEVSAAQPPFYANPRHRYQCNDSSNRHFTRRSAAPSAPRLTMSRRWSSVSSASVWASSYFLTRRVGHRPGWQCSVALRRSRADGVPAVSWNSTTRPPLLPVFQGDVFSSTPSYARTQAPILTPVRSRICPHLPHRRGTATEWWIRSPSPCSRWTGAPTKSSCFSRRDGLRLPPLSLLASGGTTSLRRFVRFSLARLRRCGAASSVTAGSVNGSCFSLLLYPQAVEMHGLSNWTEIADHVGTKTKTQCHSHYYEKYMVSRRRQK